MSEQTAQISSRTGTRVRGVTRFRVALGGALGLAGAGCGSAILGAMHALGSSDLGAPLVLIGALLTLMSAVLVVVARTQSSIASTDIRALRTAEARLTLATEASNVGLWDWNTVDNSTYFSDRFYTMLGYEPRELPMCLQTWESLVHPDDLDRAYHDIKRHCTGETAVYINEHRLRTKDGAYKWIRDVGRVVEWNEKGDPVRMTGLHIDIDEMRRNQDELERARAFLEQTAHIASVGGWEIDLTTMTPVWSKEVFRIHEVPLGQQPPLHEAINFYAPEARPVVQRAVEDAIEHGSSWDLELPLITARGRRIWIRTIGIPEFIDGVCVRLSGVFQDINEIYAAREKAQEAADRLETATTGAEIGIWDYNPITNSLIWDKTMYRVYRIDPNTPLTGFELWSSTVHPDDVDRVTQNLHRSIRSATRFVDQFRIITAQGETRYIKGIGVMKTNAQGEVVNVIGLNWDVTIEVEATNQIEQARALAEAANRAKSEFVANMSHEIRTPMTSIIGFAELLASEPGLDESRRADIVRTITRNAEHLLQLINDILDFSKIESGHLRLESIECDPYAIVNDVRELLGVRARSKGLDLEVITDGTIPDRVCTDPTRLRQVLMNIVGNAIKFTEHGRVTITLRADQQPNDRCELRFEITDTGIGMDDDAVERVRRFDPFTQADTSTTRRFGGTGLGLRISNALITQMNGSISIESELGNGTSVSFGIPCALPKVHNKPQHDELDRPSTLKLSPIGGASLSGARILLVEDGTDNRKLISFHLKKAGATLALANNGEQAIGVALGSDEPFDLILMDMQMPVIDGYQATSVLRAQHVRTPIIALTAHAMDGAKERCLSAGCDDYLSKPIDRSDLLTMCAKWIGSRSRDAA
jgi:PAS domain S-box-containing protein